jgi:NitT/TauT family transport system permease protein
MGKFLLKIFRNTAAVIVFLSLWEIAARLELFVNPLFLPPFSKVISTLFKVIVSGELSKHVVISLRRALIGYVLGVSFSVPMGLLIGWFKTLREFLNPLISLFRNTPTLALLPVFVMFFGISETSKVAVIFWGVIWAVLINTISGVKNVDIQLVKASRSMGTSSLKLFTSVILPGSLPYIFTGMRLSATTSILILIAAEMMGASRGLGYQLYFYQGRMKTPEMYAYIVFMSLLGFSLNTFLEYLERNSFKWKQEVGVSQGAAAMKPVRESWVKRLVVNFKKDEEEVVK